MSIIDDFLSCRTIEARGNRVSVESLWRELKRGIPPSQLREWGKQRLARELRQRGYAVGLIDGRQYVGDLVLLRRNSFIEMFGSLVTV